MSDLSKIVYLGGYVSYQHRISQMKQFLLELGDNRKLLCPWCRIKNRHVNPLPLAVYDVCRGNVKSWRHLVSGGHSRYCEASEMLIRKADELGISLEVAERYILD